MSNLDVVQAWRGWAQENDVFSGDTYPSEESNVDFWFADNGETANQHLHQFASTGDGSLLAIFSQEGNEFTKGPVVFLGSEGDIHVLGADVLSAVAVLALAGDDVLDSAISYGPEGEPNSALTEWVVSQGGNPVKDLLAHIGAATEESKAVVTFIEAIG